MPARKPEECDILIMEALKRKDLEVAVALYELNATFVLDFGDVVTSQATIREALIAWIAFDDTGSSRTIERASSLIHQIATQSNIYLELEKCLEQLSVFCCGQLLLSIFGSVL